jgi:hypothetical protein
VTTWKIELGNRQCVYFRRPDAHSWAMCYHNANRSVGKCDADVCPIKIGGEEMKYVDEKGNTVEVASGLGGCFIVARLGSSGGRHRIKSSALPPRKTAEECQRDLDEYAAKKKWRVVE